MLSIPADVIVVLLVTLLVATPALTCFSGLGGALTLGAARSSVLGVLVMLPLFVPVVILAAGVIARTADGASVGPLLALLAAFSLGAAMLMPLAIAAAIRLNIGGST
jgi:heme exporter protein B